MWRQASEHRRLLSAVIVLGLGGIAAAAISTSTMLNAPTATPTAIALTNPWLAPAELARAEAFRKSYGLASSDSWVRLVASDPQSLLNVGKYSIPMTDAEVAVLRTRIADRQTVLDHLEEFGRDHAAEWAGYYLDNNVIVALLIDPTGAVERELRTAAPAPFQVKPARWSLEELTALSNQVSDDHWLPANYHIMSAGVDVEHNNVALEVSSADPAAPAKIVAHFKADDDLVVSIDHTGAAVLPKGAMTGRAVDVSGKPAAGLGVELVPDIPGVDTGEIGRATDADGAFELGDIAATGYLIRLVVGPSLATTTWSTGARKRTSRTLSGLRPCRAWASVLPCVDRRTPVGTTAVQSPKSSKSRTWTDGPFTTCGSRTSMPSRATAAVPLDSKQRRTGCSRTGPIATRPVPTHRGIGLVRAALLQLERA